VTVVHRIGAVVVAVVIGAFGVLGFVGGLAYFSTTGSPIVGLSSNGLLSTISIVTAVVLVVAAVRGPRIASTVMIVVGALFLVAALANLAVLNSSLNVLAFRLTNVFFSIGAGLVLLLLGSYGRVSGHLPPDSPYAHVTETGLDDGGADPGDEYPSTPEEFRLERAIRRAEIAVIQHVASFDQRRRVAAMAELRTRRERRERWMAFDREAAERAEQALATARLPRR
jgi:hypothetical protein